MLGKSPERDREIDDVCQMIRNTARAGIPSLKYNMTFLGVVRTEPTQGRGGAAYSTFVYDKAKPAAPLTAAGPISEDVYWERITYFLNACRAGRRGVQGAPGLPSAGSRHAARPRLSGRRHRARQRRRPEAVRHDRREPVPRPELLPGHRRGDAREPGRANLRRHPLVRQRARRSSTSTSATSAAAFSTSRRPSSTMATSTC